MARCARQYDITHGQIPILYSHTFSRPAEGPSLLSHFTFLQFLLWFKSSVRLDVRSFYPLHAGDEALRAQRAEERAGARSTGLVVVTIEDYLAGARALCLRTAHRPAHCAPSSPEPRRAIVTTSTPLCCAPVQMLGSLDQDLLGHVLLRLQLVDILAVFAAACTARDMRSGVWVWLNRQRKLTVEELHGSRHAIFRMTQVVRNKLSGSLCRFYVGKSFFCFEGERDRRDHLMQLFPRESLAQRILPFFQLTAERHYMEDGCHSGALLRISASTPHLGDIGASTMVFGVRNEDGPGDADFVREIRFSHCGLTDEGAKAVAGLIRELRDLRYVNLAGNDISSNKGQAALTRACNSRVTNGLMSPVIIDYGFGLGVKPLPPSRRRRMPLP